MGYLSDLLVGWLGLVWSGVSIDFQHVEGCHMFHVDSGSLCLECPKTDNERSYY